MTEQRRCLTAAGVAVAAYAGLCGTAMAQVPQSGGNDLVISSGATTNIASMPLSSASNDTGAVLNRGDLVIALTGNPAHLVASGNGGANAGNGDVTFADGFDFHTLQGRSLNVLATNDIIIAGPIGDSDISDSDSLSLGLSADNSNQDGGSPHGQGSVLVQAPVDLRTGSFGVLTGVNYSQTEELRAQEIGINVTGDVILNAPLFAAGSLHIHGSSTINATAPITVSNNMGVSAGSMTFDSSISANSIDFSGPVTVNAPITVSNYVQFHSTSTINANVTAPGSINFFGSAHTINAGATVEASSIASHGASLTINGGSLVAEGMGGWPVPVWNSGTVRNRGNPVFLSHDSLLQFVTGWSYTLNPGQTYIVNQAPTYAVGRFESDEYLTLNGGTFVTQRFILNPRGWLQGSGGTLEAAVYLAPGSNLSISGDLTIGNASRFDGFRSDVSFEIPAGATWTLNSRGLAALGPVTTVRGQLNAANGVLIGEGDVLDFLGGSVNARLTGTTGSTIVASQSSSIGRDTHPAGFDFHGELYTLGYTLTLLDSNQAVLGSYTELAGGTLVSSRGFVVDFGENVVGTGTLTANNHSSTPTINNGLIAGDSSMNRITLNGFYKGVGSYRNVIFNNAAFSPGFSPAIVRIQSIALGSASTLIMELGGTLPGSGYDQIQIADSLTAGGVLRIELINGFVPQIGQSFRLFDGVLGGQFNSFQLPILAAGRWDTSGLYTAGTLALVVPEPALLALGGPALLMLARRRGGQK